jgi:hypothetical protein
MHPAEAAWSWKSTTTEVRSERIVRPQARWVQVIVADAVWREAWTGEGSAWLTEDLVLVFESGRIEFPCWGGVGHRVWEWRGVMEWPHGLRKAGRMRISLGISLSIACFPPTSASILLYFYLLIPLHL